MLAQAEVLKKQMDMLNAGEGHIQLPMEEQGVAAVLSVYKGQRASHDILNDLVDWAETTGNQIVLDKIYDLAKI